MVTGGGGFLGSAICRRLLERGHTVRSLARGAYPELEQKGVEVRRGDVADASAVHAAAAGCDIVFHVAAKAGIFGPRGEFERANVLGTRHVLDACESLRIPRLVYTSSPSVVFDGRDQEGIDESAPYPRRYLAWYPETKARAERAVLEASSETLFTIALRPHLIWGPGDNHLVPRIIARARTGQLRLLGPRENRVDSVYIDNAAEAHLLAADALDRNPRSRGRAYFITQGEPMPLKELLDRILACAGLPPVTRRIPPRLAYAAGCVLEGTYRLLGKTSEPRMTRFLARQLATSHWFDISAARRDLGYQPKVTMDEGFERLRAALQR
jgi:nucleoside-diphosphate-sugar epimerase